MVVVVKFWYSDCMIIGCLDAIRVLMFGRVVSFVAFVFRCMFHGHCALTQRLRRMYDHKGHVIRDTYASGNVKAEGLRIHNKWPWTVYLDSLWDVDVGNRLCTIRVLVQRAKNLLTCFQLCGQRGDPPIC